MTEPSVSVVIPVRNEQKHIRSCLDAVAAQTYGRIVEVLVVDGCSEDATADIVRSAGGNVRLLSNPERVQAAALNVALAQANGDVTVRVDGHCLIAPDYVELCVEALEKTGAAMVGGAMQPAGTGWLQEGICAAMVSPFGVGPARFHVGGPAGWVDTVYLGAFRTDLGRAIGGYRTDVGVNEDAEFAIRMGKRGGIWFDPRIITTYVPRPSLRKVTRQFYRYGRSRAATVRLHPKSIAPRQLAAPLFVASLVLPWRRWSALAYGAVLLAAAAHHAGRGGRGVCALMVTLPAMHLPWAAGFLVGLVRGSYELSGSDGLRPAVPTLATTGLHRAS